jgi:hypothetical protein
MIKTQIQLPDDLYRQVKQFSAEREWSLAETFRRAVEQFCARYPSSPMTPEAWSLPTPRNLGWKGLTAEELHAVALDDMEPRLP